MQYDDLKRGLARAVELVDIMMHKQKRMDEQLETMAAELGRITKRMRFAPVEAYPSDVVYSWDEEGDERRPSAIRSSASPASLVDVLQSETSEDEEEQWNLWSPSG